MDLVLHQPRSDATKEHYVAFPGELVTERLRLRLPSESDAELMFSRYAHDPRVSRYMSWMPHRTVDDTYEYLRRIKREDERGAIAEYLIFSLESGALLGSVGGRIQGSFVQFGYCLAFDAWGSGFGTEAARAFVTAAMSQPNIWRIHAFCDVENRASARVLEKAGLTLEGTLRRYMVLPNLGQEPRDMFCFAKVREPSDAS
jgi:RimJ/RimL family protein N-acetyltransferase